MCRWEGNQNRKFGVSLQRCNLGPYLGYLNFEIKVLTIMKHSVIVILAANNKYHEYYEKKSQMIHWRGSKN